MPLRGTRRGQAMAKYRRKPVEADIFPQIYEPVEDNNIEGERSV
jgi:hypothetical protein